MANRERGVQLHFYVSEAEYEFIRKRMARANVTSFSRFAREMLINGYIIHQDFSVLKELAQTLGGLARSINQIARRCNETKNIHTWQVEELRQCEAGVLGAAGENDGGMREWLTRRYTPSSPRW